MAFRVLVDFVKRLLNKDYRKRMSAAQALSKFITIRVVIEQLTFFLTNLWIVFVIVATAHPWLSSESHPIPLDILIYKLVKSYLHASPFKRAALKVLSS